MVYLESVKSFNDINNLKDNNIVGNPEIINSVITFKGNNNLLFCEKDVKLIGANIHFEANNSIIYLSSTNSCHYSFNALIYNNCTLCDNSNASLTNSSLVTLPLTNNSCNSSILILIYFIIPPPLEL